MRIAVLCNDTRGGIQPYAALGMRLQRAGHDVRVVAPGEFASMFAAAGLRMVPISGGSEAEMRAATKIAERGTLAAMRMMAKEVPRRIQTATRETLSACEGAEVLTGGIGGMVAGLAVAEKLDVPFVETHLQPVGAPTADYPGVMLANVPRWLGGWGRLLSHHLSEAAVWLPFRGAMRAARREVLGLTGKPRAADPRLPVLYGFSRHVVPVPAGRSRPRHVTGYWTLPTPPTWSPPAGLEDFLARGGPPVVSIGFGSMGSRDPAATTALVRGAVRDAGVRAVLLAGWGGFQASAEESDDVYCAEELPHDWLFARVAAVVHHGGAGTTGAALSAGVPSVVVPFAVDQPFWGSRVVTLGVGPQPIPRARLTRDNLAEALRQATTSEAMRTRAAALGERIRAEDGVAAAIAHFERLP